MEQNIDKLVERYGQFEIRVREQMERHCGPSCSQCRQVCCRSYYCVETRESIFLTRVMERFSKQTSWSSLSGWLSDRGCSLVAGRPPVCYEFLCHDITDAGFTGADCRHALKVLSMLVTHAGRRVIGGRHLVTAISDFQLCRMNTKRFMAQLDQAQAGLQAAMEVLNGRPLAAAALQRGAPLSWNDGQPIRRTM